MSMKCRVCGVVDLSQSAIEAAFAIVGQGYKVMCVDCATCANTANLSEDNLKTIIKSHCFEDMIALRWSWSVGGAEFSGNLVSMLSHTHRNISHVYETLNGLRYGRFPKVARSFGLMADPYSQGFLDGVWCGPRVGRIPPGGL